MPSSAPADGSPEKRRLLRKLDELRGKDFLPAELVAVVCRVAELQLDALDQVRFEDLTEQKLPQAIPDAVPPAEARAQGAFLLAPEAFPLDMALAARLVPSLLRILTESSEQFAPLARELERMLEADPALLDGACREALRAPATASGSESGGLGVPGADQGAPAVGRGVPGADQGAPVVGLGVPGADQGAPAVGSRFVAWERAHPEAPALFRFVAQSAVMPSVTVAARLLGALHRKEEAWPHGHCPICGNLPLLGRLAREEGLRVHSCSFCSFEYRAPRIGCPFCLAMPENGATYHTSADDPGYSIEVCDACKCYFKLADFRASGNVWLPALDDLASLPLDFYARQMGYARPTLSAWGF